MLDHCHRLVADKEVDLNSVSSLHSFLVNQSGISFFGFRWQVQTDVCLNKRLIEWGSIVISVVCLLQKYGAEGGKSSCANCGVACTHTHTSPKGSMCNTCYQHWRYKLLCNRYNFGHLQGSHAERVLCQ